MSQKEDILPFYITPGPTKIVTNHSKYNRIKPTQKKIKFFIISPTIQRISMISFKFESLRRNLRYPLSFYNHISKIDYC